MARFVSVGCWRADHRVLAPTATAAAAASASLCRLCRLQHPPSATAQQSLAPAFDRRLPPARSSYRPQSRQLGLYHPDRLHREPQQGWRAKTPHQSGSVLSSDSDLYASGLRRSGMTRLSINSTVHSWPHALQTICTRTTFGRPRMVETISASPLTALHVRQVRFSASSMPEANRRLPAGNYAVHRRMRS